MFGSCFCGDAESLLVTWGVDGRLCLWDGFSQGNIEAPITVLVNNPSYPIYAVDILPSCAAVGGGGGEASFLGVPVMLYDIVEHQPALVASDAARGALLVDENQAADEEIRVAPGASPVEPTAATGTTQPEINQKGLQSLDE